LTGGAAAPISQRRLFLAAARGRHVFAELRAAAAAERERAPA